MSKRHKLRLVPLALLALATPVAFLEHARASDHADTPEIAGAPGTDISDVYVFPSPNDSSKVVLAMMVHPLITSATKDTTYFDPRVLYQIKIDNTGDSVEDLVLQARFIGNNANQKVLISGPAVPAVTGINSKLLPSYSTTGTINQPFSPTTGMNVFCGVREDPFFFDLEQFLTILPDRATPISGIAIPEDQADVPQAATWRAPGSAVDFLSNGGFDVLAIVVELPKSMIGGATNKIGVWTTTSVQK